MVTIPHQYRWLPLLFLLALLCWLTPGAWAQFPPQAKDAGLKVTLTPKQITLDQKAILAIEIVGGTAGYTQPQLPPLDNFHLQLSRQQMSYTTSLDPNSTTSAQKQTFIYQLSPLKTGSFKIKPIHVQIDGRRYSSSELSIKVLPGSGSSHTRPSIPHFNPAPPSFPSLPPRPSLLPPTMPTPSAPPSNLFKKNQSRAIATPTKVYQTQRIDHQIQLYSPRSLQRLSGQNLFRPPGFVIAYLGQDQARQSYGSYQTNFHSAIFPLSAGKHSLEAITVALGRVSAYQNSQIRTKEIEVEVLPLPLDNQPANFCGAVGSFQANAFLSSSQTDKDHPTITLELDITGDGHPDFIEAPKLPSWEDVKLIDTLEEQTISSDRPFRASKVVRYILAPTRQGEVSLKDLRLSYFDPIAENYKEITIPELTFQATQEFTRPKAPEPKNPDDEEVSQGQEQSSLLSASGPFAKPFSFPLWLASGTILLSLLALKVARFFNLQKPSQSSYHLLKKELRQSQDLAQAQMVLQKVLATLAQKPALSFTWQQAESYLKQEQPQELDQAKQLWHQANNQLYGNPSNEKELSLKEYQQEIEKMLGSLGTALSQIDSEQKKGEEDREV